MRVPMVGRQHPWALKCAASACSEVRAYLLGDAWRGPDAPSLPSFGSSSFGAPPGGGGDGASGSIAHAAEEQRGEVHSAALRSLQHYGTCADARLDPRGVLDSVFYACLADTAPFKRGAPQPHTEPMPAAVAEAEK
uniref:Uncharacterized protein n=2 Tax=Emiliania huxleyi TaxID=2903 RepID=A0A7S3RP33_EMIHU